MTKSEKLNEFKKQSINVEPICPAGETSVLYTFSEGNDLVMITDTISEDNVHLYSKLTFTGKNIDYLIGNDHNADSYEFFAWLNHNGRFTDSAFYWNWVEGSEFCSEIYNHYIHYVWEVWDPDTTEDVTDDPLPKLADRLREEAISKLFDREEFLNLVNKAFHEEDSGFGVFVVFSHALMGRNIRYCKTSGAHGLIIVNNAYRNTAAEALMKEGFNFSLSNSSRVIPYGFNDTLPDAYRITY